jgi:aspartyl-tRNA(Asn)/glutamyl-tRNA(Gln) amidotransferase subunit A
MAGDLTPFNLGATTIAKDVLAGRLSALEVAEFYIKRSESFAKKLNTHLQFDPDQIRKDAAYQQSRVKTEGARMPLAGVPVLVKDNICIRGYKTTCASKILENYVSPYDATVIERLRDAGAVFFGKANCDEFAMGSSNENSAFGPVKNPWDLNCVPGGSSGGSAAAVAADLVPVALGSDTGGSIRQPASFCGIVGLKTTYGRVSRYGLVAFGSSLDQIGPMTHTVADSALVFDVISGHDQRDSTSLGVGPAKSLAGLQKTSLAGMRIGIAKEFFEEGLDPEVGKAIDSAVSELRKLGAEIKTVSLPNIKYSVATYYIIATAEASANLARFDGIRYGHRSRQKDLSLRDLYRASRAEGFGREVKQRIMLGTFALSSGYYDAYYAKANRAREMIAGDYRKAFEQVDLLVSPTAPSAAFKLGEKSNDPLSMYLSDICTIPVNLAGIPAISIPCGFTAAGLPIGLQLMAPKMGEEKLLHGAFAYEQATGWRSQRQPKLG